MSLHDWLKNGWLVKHATSSQEIANLLGIADRDLSDCKISGISPDWRLNIAYNAALQSATAALAAAGYRPSRESHHHRIIQSLAYTLEFFPDLIAQLDKFRKKRNIGGYECAGAVSDQEANEMITLATKIRTDTGKWLHENYPEFFRH